MKILRRLLDVHSLKQQVEELEASLRTKDELIRKLEKKTRPSINGWRTWSLGIGS